MAWAGSKQKPIIIPDVLGHTAMETTVMVMVGTVRPRGTKVMVLVGTVRQRGMDLVDTARPSIMANHSAVSRSSKD